MSNCRKPVQVQWGLALRSITLVCEIIEGLLEVQWSLSVSNVHELGVKVVKMQWGLSLSNVKLARETDEGLLAKPSSMRLVFVESEIVAGLMKELRAFASFDMRVATRVIRVQRGKPLSTTCTRCMRLAPWANCVRIVTTQLCSIFFLSVKEPLQRLFFLPRKVNSSDGSLVVTA